MAQLLFRVICIAVLFSAWPLEGYAEDTRIAAHTSECQLRTRTASINYNFSAKKPDMREVDTFLDHHTNRILAVAKQIGIRHIRIESQNYSISSQKHGEDFIGYRINGNVRIAFSPEEKGRKLLEVLAKDGIHASLHVNKHRQGRCAPFPHDKPSGT